MRKPRVGKRKDQGEKREVTLHRTGVEEGIVIPTLMAWATLDPNDTSRIGYLEEVAEELSTPGPKGLPPVRTGERAPGK